MNFIIKQSTKNLLWEVKYDIYNIVIIIVSNKEKLMPHKSLIRLPVSNQVNDNMMFTETFKSFYHYNNIKFIFR